MPNTMQITTMSGRTLEEVKAGIRMRMRNMVFNALEIGNDLIEAKEACEHGQWLPFLRDIGFSSSTAANYMRIAKEVSADSRMAQLPYTKILAVLAAPPEEREELAAAAEDMSAAEIKRLTEERNKAAEAANVESARAEQAERFAEELGKRIDDMEEKHQRELAACDEEAREEEREKAEKNAEHLRQKLSESEMMVANQREDLKNARSTTSNLIMEYEEKIRQLKADLLTAENNRVEVEKVPADYQMIKEDLETARKTVKELMDAAADAEERAAAAEAELEEARAESAQSGTSEYEKMHFAMKTFLMQCELMACRPEKLLRDAEKVQRDVDRLMTWCEAITRAMNVHIVEGAVV